MWGDLFGRILPTVGLIGWTAFLMVFVRWSSVRNERLRDKASAKAGETNGSFQRMQQVVSSMAAELKRLGERLKEVEEENKERCDHLQREVDECREREGMWMQRAIAAEAYRAGRGQAAQDVTIFEASRRLEGNDDA